MWWGGGVCEDVVVRESTLHLEATDVAPSCGVKSGGAPLHFTLCRCHLGAS